MRGVKVVTEEHQRIIKEMWFSHTNREIAEHLGIHKQNISYWGGRLGLPPKTKVALRDDPRFAGAYKQWSQRIKEGLTKAYAYERARRVFNLDKMTNLQVSPWWHNNVMACAAFRLRRRGYTNTPNTKVFWYDENTNRTQCEKLLAKRHNFIFKPKS